jgi:hypothetical protein
MKLVNKILILASLIVGMGFFCSCSKPRHSSISSKQPSNGVTKSLKYCNQNSCFFDIGGTQDTLSFVPIVDVAPVGGYDISATDLASLNGSGLDFNKTTGLITKQAGVDLKPNHIKVTLSAISSSGSSRVSVLVDIQLVDNAQLSYELAAFKFSLNTTTLESVSPLKSDQFSSFTIDDENKDLLAKYGLSLDLKTGVISGHVTSATINDTGADIKISAMHQKSGKITTGIFHFTVALNVVCPDLTVTDLMNLDKNAWTFVPPQNLPPPETKLSFLGADFPNSSQNLRCKYDNDATIMSNKSIPRTAFEISQNEHWIYQPRYVPQPRCDPPPGSSGQYCVITK